MTTENWVTILQACVPILVAIVGIVPTVVANRKKTQKSIEDMTTQIVEDVNSAKKAVADIETKLDEHLTEEEVHRAKQARYRILRFYDEVCAGQWHSESHYEDVLDDVDFYEAYCEKHPDFKNSRGKIAMEFLREDYKNCKAEGRFLTHEYHRVS